MATLDLHGIKHEGVVQQIHSFIYNTPLPLRIISGKSEIMRQIVVDVTRELGYHTHYERLINEGCLIIAEQEI